MQVLIGLLLVFAAVEVVWSTVAFWKSRKELGVALRKLTEIIQRYERVNRRDDAVKVREFAKVRHRLRVARRALAGERRDLEAGQLGEKAARYAQMNVYHLDNAARRL